MNNSPADARDILSNFKKATIIEFVGQHMPDEVSVERMKHAEFRTIREDVEDSVKEIRQKLKDVAQIRGTELDEKTDRMLGQIGRAMEQTDEQIGVQLKMFQEAAGHAEKRTEGEKTYDMNGGPETAEDVAEGDDSEVIDVGGQIDADETKQLPDGDDDAPAAAS